MNRHQAIIDALLPLPERLESGSYRKQYQSVAHIAYGWLMRCTRGVGAVLELQRAGYVGEAPPLMRSIVEHSVALRWLVAEGGNIMPPLKTNHGAQTQRLLDARKETGDRIRDEAHFQAVVQSVAHDEHSDDNLQHFASRVSRFGTVQDLVEYYGQMMTSHASFQSATVYWETDLGERRETARNPTDLRKACAVYLYLSLGAYSAIFAARPWIADLAAARKALVKLHPGLDRTIP